jgi:aminopeptidase-like protein
VFAVSLIFFSFLITGSEPEIHIIGNWKFLKENINPDYIKDDLISTELIDSDDCDGRGYHDKSRQCKIDHLLTCVVRNIGSPSDLEKFINIFETDQQFIADKLKLPIEVPDWSKGGK